MKGLSRFGRSSSFIFVFGFFSQNLQPESFGPRISELIVTVSQWLPVAHDVMSIPGG